MIRTALAPVSVGHCEEQRDEQSDRAVERPQLELLRFARNDEHTMVWKNSV